MKPRLISWNVTRACNLRCSHCYRDAGKKGKNELSTQEVYSLMENISSLSKPILILSGGEPLVRSDLYDIIRYGSDLGFRVVLGTNGTLIDDEVASRLYDAGTKRVGISIDSTNPKVHDNFRGVDGAFEKALKGAEACKKIGLSFQIHTTVTKYNYSEIPQIIDLALDLGADAYHLFFFVPTGRGITIKDKDISPEEYESLLSYLYERQEETDMFLKTTCAPQYFRIMLQKGKKSLRKVKAEKEKRDLGREDLERLSRGCLAGTAYCCILPEGDVHPCPYMPIKLGNVRELEFTRIWNESSVLKTLREGALKGKCGLCKYRNVCVGCRARAYAYTGDFLQEDPMCMYNPV
ncbi:MAG: radical SAM protein [Candidatus Hydrothermarchaeota archaeon]